MKFLAIAAVGASLFLVIVVVVLFSQSVPESERSAPSLSNFSLSMVSGTEYHYNEEGQVIVEVRNAQAQRLAANCSAQIWYPNKTTFINQNMTESATGNHFINFTIPREEGVYEYQANCTALGASRVVSKSFHVSNPALMAVTPT